MKTPYLFIFVLFFSMVTMPAISWATPLATLDGQDITEAEVDKIAKPRMTKLLSQMYDIKLNAINQIIDDRLLLVEAKKKGLTVDKFRKKLMDEAGDVTESEAKAIYQLQKKRYKDKTFDQIKKQLMSQLSRQKKQMAVEDYLATLRKKANIKINIERPRAKVSTDDDPSMGGSKNAPITVIEFTEYQCPFCKRARPTIQKILDTYKDQVHYVLRDFPLSFHKQAKGAANAAQCAGDQGKYWEYSDELWKTQGKHTEETLNKIATDIKLNMDKFKKCTSSKKYYAEIDKDQNDGIAAGVTGTPAYFINGLFLSGAQPFQSFKKLIDEELARKK